jgi:nucleoside diphosphate kinase
MKESTFVMIKPDGVQRGLCGEIIRRFEAKGLKLAGLKLKIPSRELAAEHYAELVAVLIKLFTAVIYERSQ